MIPYLFSGLFVVRLFRASFFGFGLVALLVLSIHVVQICHPFLLLLLNGLSSLFVLVYRSSRNRSFFHCCLMLLASPYTYVPMPLFGFCKSHMVLISGGFFRLRSLCSRSNFFPLRSTFGIKNFRLLYCLSLLLVNL